MATHDYVLDNATGANFRSDLNNALAAIVSNNSSSSEPSTKYAYQWWADTTAGVLKIRNSANDGWVTLLQLDGTLTLEDGSASAPALGFRDDLNTGIFSSGADNLDITTGGTTRVNVSSTGINVTGTVVDDGATHDGDVTFTGASANIVFDKSDNQFEFADGATAEFGTGGDFDIFHDGTDNRLNCASSVNLRVTTDQLIVNNAANNEEMLKAIANGACELYYDAAKVFETTTNGVIVLGTEGQNGNLYIFADEGDDNADKWRLKVDTNGQFEINNFADGSYERSIECNGSGNVELYFDNTLRAATVSSGLQVNGVLTTTVSSGQAIQLTDNARMELGSGDDLKLFHNGTDSFIQNTTGTLKISTQGGSDEVQINKGVVDEHMAKFIADGAVKLYHNNVQTFETSTNGIIIRGPEGGEGQLFLNADEGDDFADIWRFQVDTSGIFTLSNGASGSYETNIEANTNGNVELYFDNSKKFNTTSAGATVTGALTITTNLFMGDNDQIKLGDNQDYIIYHESGNSYILADLFFINNLANSENIAKFQNNGAVSLYYDNSKKFETTSAGVTVTGTVTDSKGELRQIPQANHQGGTHTLQASDAGKHLLVDNAVTIPPTSGVFSTGDAITLISTSGSDISVNRGSGVTMYNAADGTNANRTLATRGIATVICTGSNTYNISGAGLS